MWFNDLTQCSSNGRNKNESIKSGSLARLGVVNTHAFSSICMGDHATCSDRFGGFRLFGLFLVDVFFGRRLQRWPVRLQQRAEQPLVTLVRDPGQPVGLRDLHEFAGFAAICVRRFAEPTQIRLASRYVFRADGRTGRHLVSVLAIRNSRTFVRLLPDRPQLWSGNCDPRFFDFTAGFAHDGDGGHALVGGTGCFGHRADDWPGPENLHNREL